MTKEYVFEEPVFERCDCCGKHISELEPFDSGELLKPKSRRQPPFDVEAALLIEMFNEEFPPDGTDKADLWFSWLVSRYGEEEAKDISIKQQLNDQCSKNMECRDCIELDENDYWEKRFSEWDMMEEKEKKIVDDRLSRCWVCGRHIRELKPFGGPGDPLVGDFSGELLVKTFRRKPDLNKGRLATRKEFEMQVEMNDKAVDNLTQEQNVNKEIEEIFGLEPGKDFAPVDEEKLEKLRSKDHNITLSNQQIVQLAYLTKEMIEVCFGHKLIEERARCYARCFDLCQELLSEVVDAEYCEWHKELTDFYRKDRELSHDWDRLTWKTKCEVCGKHTNELKPFGGPGDPLVGDFSGQFLVRNFRPGPSWECRDCIVLKECEYFKAIDKRHKEDSNKEMVALGALGKMTEPHKQC